MGTYGIYLHSTLVDTRADEESALAVAAALSESKFHGETVSVQTTDASLRVRVVAEFKDGQRLRD
jgi:hypothetical protein